jgi:prefoldin alpha subunit
MAEKKDAEKAKRMQQKYLGLQLLDQQMRQVQKQVGAIEQQAMELAEVQQNLDELGKSSHGSGMLVPVAPGIFVKARLEDNKRLAVNVGSNVVATKDIPAAKAMLAAREEDLRRYQAELVQQFEQMAEQAAGLQRELQQLAGE